MKYNYSKIIKLFLFNFIIIIIIITITIIIILLFFIITKKVNVMFLLVCVRILKLLF